MTRFRVLVTDGVDPRGVELLRAEPSLVVDERPTRPWQEPRGEIGEYDAFVGRSATGLPAELLREAKRLQVIGRAGVATANIDASAATALGIVGLGRIGGEVATRARGQDAELFE